MLDWFISFINQLPLDEGTKNFVKAFGGIFIIILPIAPFILFAIGARLMIEKFITGPMLKKRIARDMIGRPFDELERLTRDYYTAQGYQVFHVGKSGDQGADVVAMKDKQRFVIQCKNWSKPAGTDVVRTTEAARQRQDAQKAILISSSGFTGPAISLARTLDIELKDGADIEKMRRVVIGG